MCFFTAHVAEKTKCGTNAATQGYLQFVNRLKPFPVINREGFFSKSFLKSFLKALFSAFLFTVINLTAAVAKLILSGAVFLKLDKVIDRGLCDIRKRLTG